jgi:hypothetical protein
MTLLWLINVRPSKVDALSMLSLVTYHLLSQWLFPIGYVLSSALLVSYVPTLGTKTQSVQFRMNNVRATTIAETYLRACAQRWRIVSWWECGE